MGYYFHCLTKVHLINLSLVREQNIHSNDCASSFKSHSLPCRRFWRKGLYFFPLAIFRNSPFVSKQFCLILAFCACAIAGLTQSRNSFPSGGYQLQPEWRAIVWPWAWPAQFACCLIPILSYCTAVLYFLNWKKSQPNAAVAQSIWNHKNMPKPKVIMWARSFESHQWGKQKHTLKVFFSLLWAAFSLRLYPLHMVTLFMNKVIPTYQHDDFSFTAKWKQATPIKRIVTEEYSLERE